MQTQTQTQTYFVDQQAAREYLMGERQGRQDGAMHWGKLDTSKMSEATAMGYNDGYEATRGL